MANDEELCDSIQIAPKKLKEPANIFLEIKNPDKLLKNNNFVEEGKKVCPKNLIRDRRMITKLIGHTYPVDSVASPQTEHW